MSVDRYEAPNYLAKYRERQNRKVEETPDDGTPLYLRRFRAKGAEVPVETVDGESFTRDYAASTREKEIVAPPERKAAGMYATRTRAGICPETASIQSLDAIVQVHQGGCTTEASQALEAWVAAHPPKDS